MLPLLNHPPSLIFAEPVRPGSSRIDGQPLLTPGEAVRATVVGAGEDGALLLLIKGVELRAASLVGGLSVGQILDAHVELRDGRTLLKLDQPLQVSISLSATTQATDSSTAGLEGAPRVAAILKTLLPADEPLALGLAKLSASLRAAVERGDLTAQTMARFRSLEPQLFLQSMPPGDPLAGEQIRRVLLALGVRHEQALLADWRQTGNIAGQTGDRNLKALLMTLLEETGAWAKGVPVAHSSDSTLPNQVAGQRPSLSQPEPAGYGASLIHVSDGAGSHFSSAVTQAQQESSTPSSSMARPAPARQADGAQAPVVDERLMARSETSAFSHQPQTGAGPSSEVPGGFRASSAPQADAAVPGPLDMQRDPVAGGRTGDGQEGAGRAESVVPAGSGRPAHRQPWFSDTLPVGLVGRFDESDQTAGALAAQSRVPSEEPEQRRWIRDAQQVLAIIERTQALAALNSQAGQPLFFELPLAWGGQVRLYVEERDAGGKQEQGAPRPYNIVTLLDLDGIGAVRVDTLLTGTRLAARFLLDQADVQRRVAAYLPALTRSLAARGYQVDLLTSDLAQPQHVRGEDLRARSVPRLSLVNMRA